MKKFILTLTVVLALVRMANAQNQESGFLNNPILLTPTDQTIVSFNQTNTIGVVADLSGFYHAIISDQTANTYATVICHVTHTYAGIVRDDFLRGVTVVSGPNYADLSVSGDDIAYYYPPNAVVTSRLLCRGYTDGYPAPIYILPYHNFVPFCTHCTTFTTLHMAWGNPNP